MDDGTGRSLEEAPERPNRHGFSSRAPDGGADRAMPDAKLTQSGGDWWPAAGGRRPEDSGRSCLPMSPPSEAGLKPGAAERRPPPLVLALVAASILGGACGGCGRVDAPAPGPKAVPVRQTPHAVSSTPQAGSGTRRGTCSPQDVRAAMARLRSFEAHRTSTERQWDGSLRVFSLHIRFERPDRHSWVARGWLVGASGAAGSAEDVGEARQIGTSFWWRRSEHDQDSQWTCQVDETQPDPLAYAPPLDAVLIGAEATWVGDWLRFRSTVGDTEETWWINAGSCLVQRIEYTRGGESEFEIVEYWLGAFNTPSRIAAPGPCVAVTATGQPD